ncbi:MAG: hypothetical protein PHE56_08360 [Bacteroidales bacterium]|nr:hypothetical protein [Bacteroidales bacterium]
MTREERLIICKKCTNRKPDLDLGLICSLTGAKADFESICNDYIQDELVAKQENEKQIEKEIAEKGRKKTVTFFFFMIGVSVSVMAFSFLTFRQFTVFEVTKVLIRLGFEVGLFYAVFIGKNWARTILSILYIIGILVSLLTMFAIIDKSPLGFIMLILVLTYGFAVYFINADKDFKVFFEYQKKNR